MNKQKINYSILWSKFHYGVKYGVGLEHSLLYIYFYSILEEKIEFGWRCPKAGITFSGRWGQVIKNRVGGALLY